MASWRSEWGGKGEKATMGSSCQREGSCLAKAAWLGIGSWLKKGKEVNRKEEGRKKDKEPRSACQSFFRSRSCCVVIVKLGTGVVALGVRLERKTQKTGGCP